MFLEIRVLFFSVPANPGPDQLATASSYGRNGKRLGPPAAARCSSWSKSGPALVASCGPCGPALCRQLPATANIPLHRRAQTDVAARRRAGGSRWARRRTRSRRIRCAPSFQRPPTSAPRTTKRCGPPELRVCGMFASLCHAQGRPIGLSRARLWLA